MSNQQSGYSKGSKEDYLIVKQLAPDAINPLSVQGTPRNFLSDVNLNKSNSIVDK